MKRHKPAPPKLSWGAVKLAVWLEGHIPEVAAERLGVSYGCAQHWRAANRTPRGSQRLRIFEVAGIPLGDWDLECRLPRYEAGCALRGQLRTPGITYANLMGVDMSGAAGDD